MINRNLFFSSFQLNYFDYKQLSSKYLLENYSKVGLDKCIYEYSENDHVTAIRSDIRQTYFQAIETVFEVFFALLPDKNGRINDNRIIERITLSELPYSKISDIAQNENALDYLDTELIYPNNPIISLGEFIFYYGLHNMDNLKKEISDSVKAIKYGLRILATEFSDRREYNSYKHGLRILPALDKLALCEIGTMKEQLSWDFNGSMTFYSFDKKTKETTYTTKLYDTERDFRMTSICSWFLWNMIKFRDVAYNNDKKDNNTQFAIPFYSKDIIDEAIKTDVKIQDLKISIIPED